MKKLPSLLAAVLIFAALVIYPSQALTAAANGISLCGGGAMLHGMSMMIEGITGYPTVLVERPLEAAALGMARIQEWLPAQIPSGVRNISAYYIESFLSGK